MMVRSFCWISLGALSAACAGGAFVGGTPRSAIEGVEATEGSTTIAGGVFDSQSTEPIESALLVLQCDCLDGVRETQTNANGLFVFRELPPGTYTVQLLHHQQDLAESVPIQADQTARLRFVVSNEPLVRT